jgi:glycosyltransferase involved in cell wall biosynthesis
VAMCTYNGSRFLPEQLESIAIQTRPPDELVVCDDNSSDHSAEIVRQVFHRVPFPVRLVVNDHTLGSVRNFEKAISLCQKQIVALADQDDIWYPHKLERLERTFLTSSKVVAAFSDADVIDEDSRPLSPRLWASFSFGVGEQRRFSAGDAIGVLAKYPVVTGAAMAFRREFFDMLAPIPEGDVHHRWMSFLLAACGPFQPISEPLMQYRRHARQQIGPGASTLRDRLARARNTGPQFYREEIERFQRLRQRLRQHPTFAYQERALAEVSNKLSHLEHRIQLRRMNMARIPRVFREVCNRGYWRYGAGWESVAKDLFLYERSNG